MKLSRLLLLALALPALATAQTVTVTAPTPVNPNGQPKAVGTTFIVNADGSIATIGMDTGTPGSPPPGGATVVAGSDGTAVRTIATDTSGRLSVYGTTSLGDGRVSTVGTTVNGLSFSSYESLFNGATFDRQRTASAADATTGIGLLGAGILGQYQAALPSYASGQFGTLAMNNKGVLLVNQFSTASLSGDAQGANWTGAGTQSVASQDLMFNGTTWDRVRGDTTGGLYVQERERSQYFVEAPGIVAANATFAGATRDGGTSPSQWGTFSCFVRSDQSGTVLLDGSADATFWYSKISSAVTGTAGVRLTDRNDSRYHRCRYVNNATANTAATILNSSFGQ